MGNLPIMDNKDNNSSKEGKLNLEECKVIGTDERGSSIVELPSGDRGLVLVLSLDDSLYLEHKDQLINRFNIKLTYLSNVLSYEVKKQSYLCNQRVQVSVLLEHHTLSLARALETSNYSSLQNSSIEATVPIGSQIDVINLTKFLLEAAQEGHQSLNKWITFHTKFIQYDHRKQEFKYQTLPTVSQAHESEGFFDYEREDTSTFSPEKQTIFSIGMVLLSVLLQQDCSVLYNFQYMTFCQSLFEDKLQKLDEKYATKPFQELMQNSLLQSEALIHEDFYQLVMSSLQPREERPTLKEFKKQFYGLLRRVSMHHSSVSHTASIIESLTTVRKAKIKHHHSNPQIHFFSTNEAFSSNQVTIGQKQQSSFGALSPVKPSQTNMNIIRSSQAVEGVRKGKDKISVVQKKKRRGEDKENILQPFGPKFR